MGEPAPPAGEARYVRAPAARLKEAGGRLAVYVPSTRGIHVLNPTARLLLTYLDEPAGVDELARMLVAATDGDEATIRRDLDEVLGELVAAGVVARAG